jgi:hypothetical protein
MRKFEVWSTPYEGAPQLEVTRTDAKVAHDDAGLIRNILHRSAEVREVTPVIRADLLAA